MGSTAESNKAEGEAVLVLEELKRRQEIVARIRSERRFFPKGASAPESLLFAVAFILFAQVPWTEWALDADKPFNTVIALLLTLALSLLVSNAFSDRKLNAVIELLDKTGQLDSFASRTSELMKDVQS